MVDAGSLTDLLQRARAGDDSAADRLFESAYPELRRMAHARLSQSAPHTMLDTTALVHECYMRFVRSGQLQVEDRAHFLGYTGKIMRSVIVDAARDRSAQRRGGAQRAVTLDSQIAAPGVDAATEILALHAALDGLAEHDPRMVRVVELRYFAGLTEVQIAESLGVTERTVRRDWEKARLLLAEVLLRD
jgi:RNA polymerase sigma factor (TIGR02999 family)